MIGYSKLLRPLLFRAEPETAHHWTVSALAKAGRWSVARQALSAAFTYSHPSLKTTVAGLNFPNPVGLAAGFDKDGCLAEVLPALGFGFMELGTVTAEPQPGNPPPRVFRVPECGALINRLGFNSAGAAQVAERLSQVKVRPVPLGINIGINADVLPEEASLSYAKTFSLLYPHADYLAINVSSPNTVALRQLQDPRALERILLVLGKINPQRKPIFVKLSPDLEEDQIKNLVPLLQEHASGAICTNTTLSRPGLAPQAAALPGGLSGSPLNALSTRVIRAVYRFSAGRLPIIGVGGIFSAEDAYEKIQAGASLIQIYTGLIYRGPGIVSGINRGLVRLLKKDGLNTVAQAVGMSNIIK